MAIFKNKEELLAAVESGAVSKVKHPHCDLWIYNYTRAAIREEDSAEAAWDSPTLRQCRGLILDKDYNVVARPFEKFFNYEELEASPELARKVLPEGTLDLPCEITEKLDGSLGILYWPMNESLPALATRSTFTSDQALHGTATLRQRLANFPKLKIPAGKTFLFEIIYPENKLVVNYGDLDDIILLAVIDNETGKEDDLANYPGWRKPENYGSNWRGIREDFESRNDERNREGFVVRFSNGVRVKLKFKEYFRLHWLAGKLSQKNMLRLLSEGKEQELRALVKDVANGDEEAELVFNEQIQQLLDLKDWYYNVASQLTKFPEEFESKAEWADYVRRQGRFAPAIFILARQPDAVLAGRQVGKQYASLAQARREMAALNAALWRLVESHDYSPSEFEV